FVLPVPTMPRACDGSTSPDKSASRTCNRVPRRSPDFREPRFWPTSGLTIREARLELHFLQFSTPRKARLTAQAPFFACVRNPETLTLSIALGTAARLSDHYCQVASMVKGVAHTLVKERCLQPTMPQLRNCSRAAEQSDAVVDAQHASGARFSLVFSKKAHTALARGRDGTEV